MKLEQALALLEDFVIKEDESFDIRDVQQVARKVKATISGKQFGYEDLLSPLIARACIDVCPKNPHNFNVDNVRVCKIQGSSLAQSQVLTRRRHTRTFLLGYLRATRSVVALFATAAALYRSLKD